MLFRSVLWSLALGALWAIVFALFHFPETSFSSRRVGWLSFPLRGLMVGIVILAAVLFGTSNADPFVYYYF